jgi:FkbM family methyltransferase
MKLLPNGLAVLANDLASRWIEECGDLVHEPTVRQEICPHIKPGDIVVDAGAYLGSHTKAYLEAVGPTGKVLAFEPNVPAFNCLRLNCPKAILFNTGLGSTKEKRIALIPTEHAGNEGASYWKPGAFAATAFIPLDSLGLNRVDFIKLDVEGMEPQVIAGASKTLLHHRPILYVELNVAALARFGTRPKTLVAAIETLGYRLQFMRPEHTVDSGEINVFFFPT